VTEDAFAFIHNTPFVIQNISEGGMKLKSVVFDEQPPDEMMLDIFLKDDNFYLQDIPVRLISFNRNKSLSPFGSAHTKYFGLQFGELTEQQKTRLDYFISRSSAGEA
jgi:hypothetical protein